MQTRAPRPSPLLTAARSTATSCSRTAGSGPGLLVLQEIFGVNAYIREVCDRLAGLGYVAMAPDVFWRIEPNVDINGNSDEAMGQRSATSSSTTGRTASPTSSRRSRTCAACPRPAAAPARSASASVASPASCSGASATRRRRELLRLGRARLARQGGRTSSRRRCCTSGATMRSSPASTSPRSRSGRATARTSSSTSTRPATRSTTTRARSSRIRPAAARSVGSDPAVPRRALPGRGPTG